MISNLDDVKKANRVEATGATVVRGRGEIAAPGRVEVDGRVLEAKHIVVARPNES